MKKTIITTMAFACAILLFSMCRTKGEIPVGSTWQLQELKFENNQIELPAESSIYIKFDTDNQFSGNAGCNNYFGDYSVETETEMLIEPSGITKMLCPYIEIEDKYIKSISTIFYYSVNDRTLIMESIPKDTKLVFTKR